MDDTFFSIEELPLDYLRPGTARRSLRIGDLLLMFINYERPTVSPAHQHDFDSVLFVHEGELEVTVGEKTHHLRPGLGARVPAGVIHGLVTQTATASIVEAWYPVPERGDAT